MHHRIVVLLVIGLVVAVRADAAVFQFETVAEEVRYDYAIPGQSDFGTTTTDVMHKIFSPIAVAGIEFAIANDQVTLGGWALVNTAPLLSTFDVGDNNPRFKLVGEPGDPPIVTVYFHRKAFISGDGSHNVIFAVGGAASINDNFIDAGEHQATTAVQMPTGSVFWPRTRGQVGVGQGNGEQIADSRFCISFNPNPDSCPPPPIASVPASSVAFRSAVALGILLVAGRSLAVRMPPSRFR